MAEKLLFDFRSKWALLQFRPKPSENDIKPQMDMFVVINNETSKQTKSYQLNGRFSFPIYGPILKIGEHTLINN